ncbi:MAG TPA: DUF2934 domain-containing protein [Rhodoferax sp.]|nr:DUF2934 domain-containing protein [Rhodoferax sp.]
MKTKTKSMPKSTENQSAQQEGDMGIAVYQVCPREQMVAQAAYYLSEQRGFSPGNDLGDWLSAEVYIDSLRREPVTVHGMLHLLRRTNLEPGQRT